MNNKPLNIVAKYLSENNYNYLEKELFIVWSCYILGNRKYLVGCEGNNLYFEVTYNTQKDEWYLDVYDKIDVVVINNN